MLRLGVVKDAHGDHAEVVSSLRGPCGECSEHGSCGMTFTVGPMENRPEMVTVENTVGARPGDTVEIDFAGHTELKLSLLVWFVPVMALIGGAVVGVALSDALPLSEDASALAGAGLFFAASYVLLRAVDRRVSRTKSLIPRIVKVVDPTRAVAAACPSDSRKKSLPVL